MLLQVPVFLFAYYVPPKAGVGGVLESLLGAKEKPDPSAGQERLDTSEVTTCTQYAGDASMQ